MPLDRRRVITTNRAAPLILVSNDDGVHAEGMQALAKQLRAVGRVVVVAPDQQRSASSHSLTLHRPLRVHALAKDIYAIDGTPTDCINLAVNEILKEQPDLLVSGINHGPNLGEDVHYSGTVSAAIEGGILGIPSIAVSLVGRNEFHFEPAAAFAVRLARRVLKEKLPEGIILNVNVPNIKKSDLEHEFTFLGERDYGDIIVEKIDPRGQKYYWIGGDEAGFSDIPHSDCNAVMNEKISITPLRIDMTDHETLKRVRTWKL